MRERNIALVTGASAASADAALAEVGLEGLESGSPASCRSVSSEDWLLARAFAAVPDLLLLDEPFVSLDPALVEEMLSLTGALLTRRRIATILVTHDMREARRLAGRILRIEGAPAHLRSDPAFG